MRARHVWKFIFIVLTTTACSAQSSNQEMAKALKSVLSWTATAHMVGESWLQGNVPTPYTQQTLHKSQEELQTEMDSVKKVTPTQQQKVTLDRLQRLQQTLGQMTTDVEQKDRAALTTEIEKLTIQEQALQTLLKDTGEQP